MKTVIQKIKYRLFDEFIDVPDDDRVTHYIKKKTREIGNEVDYYTLRKEYFNNIERFNKIRENIKNLTIIDKKTEITEFCKTTELKFTKIYLSNIFTTMSNGGIENGKYDFSEFSADLETICKPLINSGLLYFADGDVIRYRLKKFEFNSLFRTRFSLKNLNLKVDKNKTKKAREYEKGIESRVPLILIKN